MKRALALVAALAFATSANAVITLDDVTPVDNGFRFDYRLTLGPDEGLTDGDRLIVFDFAGYVDGSIFAPGMWDTSIEFTSMQPPFVSVPDMAGLPNLIFTYRGDPLRASGGPFESFTMNGFGAVSVFGQTFSGFFATRTTKNNPPALSGTPIGTGGSVLVPGIPEPATWAMMIAGFGMVGFSMRRRRSVPQFSN